MKFKVDENLPSELATDLAAAGHDSQTVLEEGLAGIADPAIVAAVQRERRILLTMDKGIADVRAYPLDQLRWPAGGLSPPLIALRIALTESVSTFARLTS